MAKSSTSWRRGQTGNPKGRPKKEHSLTDILAKYAPKKVSVRNVQTGQSFEVERREKLAQGLWDLALRGDLAAIKYVFDRIDGKPTEPVEHGGKTVIEFDKVIDDAVRSDPSDYIDTEDADVEDKAD